MMRCFRVGAGFVTALFLASAMVFAGDKSPPSVAAIDEAIRRGQEFLIRMQRIDGSWSKVGQDVAGYTALNALALVKSGIPADHPTVVKALNYISHRKTSRTYCLSVIAQFLEAAAPEKHRDMLERCVELLVDSQKNGLWDYPGIAVDMSNTQYAAMGLRAAAACGIKIHRKVWEDLLLKTVSLQCEDGGWGYRVNSKSTGSMTCAALTCILIARERLGDHGRRAWAVSQSEKSLEKGLAWLDRHILVNRNPRPHEDVDYDRWPFYYLYGLERVGALSDRKKFGDTDWYAEGASWLLRKQNKEKGCWGSAYGENEMNTPLALLFLIRATHPSFTRHGMQSRITTAGKGEDAADIVLACDRRNPGHVWIESWSPKVAALFGVDDGETAILVRKVEYLANGELLAEVTEDPTGGRITRYPFKYAFTKNGEKEITARVTCATDDGLAIKTYDSSTVKVFVHNVLTDEDRGNMEDLEKNLIRGAGPQVIVSTSWSADWVGKKSVDGLQGTSWLSAKDEKDEAPWIRLVFPKPVRADLLKVAHAYSDHFKPGRYGRAVKVRVLINRGAQKITADLGTEDGVKYEIPFKKVRVRDITIEMLERVKGTDGHLAAGFSEIELFLKPKNKK